MIIKIKKRSLFLAIVIALCILVPFVYPQVQRGFGVFLNIQNIAPTIKINNASGFTVIPVESGVSVVRISFNVSDSDGVTQINATTAVINLSLGDTYWRSNISNIGGEIGTCNNHTESNGGGNIVVINCTVVMYYYDNASNAWTINVTVKDTQGGVARNNSLTFTYQELSAMRLPNTFINFSNVNLGTNNLAAYPHLLVNNTGNSIFDQINITAASLVGVTTPSETISPTNFAANTSNNTLGNGAALSTAAVTLRDNFGPSGELNNATLYPGHTSSPFLVNADKGNVSVFFWVDVPSSGLSAQAYNATWNLTVINLP